MNIDVNEKVRRKPEILTAFMDDEVVMMSADQGQYFGLSSVGAHIWELAEAPVRVGELIESVCEHYDVVSQECEADILVFLNNMLEADLMEVTRS